jgi:hypothetical protein
VTDCEVLLVDGATASDIGSRHADLASALDRMATTRRRRIERIMDGRARQAIADADGDEPDTAEPDVEEPATGVAGQELDGGSR